MIPFDVEPGPYILLIVSACAIIFMYFSYEWTPNFKGVSIFVGSMFAVLMVIAMGGILCESTYTDTITICAHTFDRGSMTVIDTNQNIYYVGGQITQFKVKDGATVKVKIIDSPVGKRIYSIDAPITCGNQTCGVPT
jgi:hypothetical protein